MRIMTDRPDLAAIAGLRWSRNWRLPNGGQSFVVPVATRRSFNVVFHGREKFSYGHYGVHLGQEDRLTFLGAPDRIITARFMDLRAGSPTGGRRLTVQFAPGSEYELRIPPGVAHDFDGLEQIDTVNNYAVYLPDPARWAAGEQEWDMDADIVNVPHSVADAETAESETKGPAETEGPRAPRFHPNARPASDVFYRLLAERQREGMAHLAHSHAYTVDTRDASGSPRKLKISERAQRGVEPRDEPIPPIAGLHWQQLAYVESGPASGIRPFFETRPYYMVDHGTAPYAHDAFGIHLGQDDHLTFLGSDDASVEVQFVDCRRGSATLHAQVALRFSPCAHRTLVIPRGVAHRFTGLENVVTLNQGVAYLDRNGDYEPATDVIDWPVGRSDYPVLAVNDEPAGEEYYDALVAGQQRMRATGAAPSTPMVLMVPDATGKPVSVAIRQQG
ncbi:hypothetical protein A9995_11705 [Erythrobacter sp. QSSC1-22B]|nr:hypothetical protein A9995_11705 [Erythrobacter sp. QSSC1-22B]